uniref:Uncharacterized protein n=1 Tax=viral metagenome TaxID=1070528 RepID=A0A6M3J878_9ZZZZ
MQKIIVKEVRGPLGRGEKKFYAVVDEKGAEFTTFDTKISQVTPNSLVEIEVKVEGKYANITDWKVLEAGLPPANSKNGNGAYGKTPEQFDAERRSIEAQTAFKGIIELWCSPNSASNCQIEESTLRKAIKWAEARLDATMPVQTITSAPESPKQATSEKSHGNGFKNRGEFLTACLKEYKLTGSEVCAVLEVKSIEDIEKTYGSLEKAYLVVVECMTKK